MAKAAVQAQWRGFVRAIAIACVMAGIGMWAMGWLDRDVTRIGGDLLNGARRYLGVQDRSNSLPAPPRPGLYYSDGKPLVTVPALGGGNGLTGVDAETYEHAAKGAMVGRVQVLDSNTLAMNGHQIRFWGVDVPELAQPCSRDGRPWRCGAEAMRALNEYINTHLVACYDKGLDANNQILGQCFIGQIDLNGWLARNGWAFSYRRVTAMYESRESMARFQRLGIWRDSGVEAPWEWRKAHPQLVQ